MEKKDEILVSIIVPVYNVEKYIEKCIRSICNQSYNNIEIILVDDGSKDNSGNLCDEYAVRDKRIKVIHKKNEGLVRARKAGFLVSTGKLIANIDGDDWIDSEMISDFVNIYHETQADFIQGGLVCEGKKQDRIQYTNFVDNLTDENTVSHLTKWLSGREYIYGSQLVTKVIERSVFEASYFQVADDMNHGEDLLSFLYYMNYARKAVSTDRVYYHYWVRNNSISHNKNGIYQLLSEDRLTEQVVRVIKKLSLAIPDDAMERWVIRRKGYIMMEQIPTFKEHLLTYELSNVNRYFGKKVVVYGAGKVGQDLFRQLSVYEQVSIIAWIDRYPQQYHFPFKQIHEISYLKEITYDLIIVAVQKRDMALQIEKELVEFGVNRNQILWEDYPSFLE